MLRKQSSNAIKNLSLCIPILALAACVTLPWRLNDLDLQSIEIKTPDKIFDNREMFGHPFPFDKVLVINFLSRSGANLYKIKADYQYYVYFTTTICSHKKLDPSRAIPNIADIYGPAGSIETSRYALTRYSNISQSFHYYLTPSGDRLCVSAPCYPPYNLISKPEDICFRVEGGSMIGTHSKSNVVVIPKSALIAAFDAAHIPHGQ